MKKILWINCNRCCQVRFPLKLQKNIVKCVSNASGQSIFTDILNEHLSLKQLNFAVNYKQKAIFHFSFKGIRDDLTSCALTASQSEEVASLLFNSKPQEEVLRFGNIIIDVNDVSTLVGERYLTGFVIDGACLKYCEEAQASGAQSLFLPSLVQTWASSGDCNFLCSKLKPFISSRVQNQIQWLLTPILVNNNHWGLLCLNMVSSQAYFDDGLKVNPPVNICAISQILSEAVNMALPNLQQPKWDNMPPIQRFGMPLQPLTGEGCGSCGMGVILAGKDFLSSGARIPSFSWCFQEMTKHRQYLLHQFVQWKQ